MTLGVILMLMDTGFGGLDLKEFATASGRPVREVVRIESVAERLLARDRSATRTLDRFADAFQDRLVQGLEDGAVGLKSVAAYRTGLALPRPRTAEVRQAFTGRDRAGQARRLDNPSLVAFLLWRAAELGAERQVPLQLHTGFGDTDLDLALADPTLLRPLFVIGVLRAARSRSCTATRSSPRQPIWPVSTRRYG